MNALGACTGILLFLSISEPVRASVQEKPQHGKRDSARESEIDVLSFNILADHMSGPDYRDGVNRSWEERMPVVFGVIRNLMPDFAGLQELDFVQQKDIKSSFPEYTLIGDTWTCILYRNDRWSVVDSGFFPIPASEGENRIVRWARFGHKGTRKTVYFYSTHFTHVGSESGDKDRFDAAKVLALHVAEREHDEDPVIVTGDFNSGKQSNAIRYLIGKHEKTPAQLTFANHGVGIDHILILPDMKAVEQQRVPSRDSGSDHPAIYATVVIPHWPRATVDQLMKANRKRKYAEAGKLAREIVAREEWEEKIPEVHQVLDALTEMAEVKAARLLEKRATTRELKKFLETWDGFECTGRIAVKCNRLGEDELEKILTSDKSVKRRLRRFLKEWQGFPVHRKAQAAYEQLDRGDGSGTLEAYLAQTFAHVARIGDFYIAAGDRKPQDTDCPSATGMEVFDTAVRLFESLLDQDEDGAVDRPPLLAALAKHLVFVIDHTEVTDTEENKIQSRYGKYVMTMKSDIWPYMPSFNTDNCDLALTELNTSMWRPETYNALWEECFHTITEAQNRIDPGFSFQPSSVLGGYMQADIDAGTYDTSEQNKLEGGDYDFVTAVNEYVHQVWLINACGGGEILNTHQQAILTRMGAAGIPLTVNPDYALDLAKTVQ